VATTLALTGGLARAAAEPAPEPAEAAPGWEYSVSAYAYWVPEGRDYVQSAFTADRGSLHLEARYNYEDLETGSLWGGYTFDVDGKVALEITPMLGAVLGRTDGLAPGYRFSLDWWRLSLYTEGEVVFDAHERSDSFFYSWSELTVSPVAWLRAGIVAQKTEVYEYEREIQRGLLVGGTVGPVTITGHVFNPDDSDPTWVLAVEVDF